MAVDTTSGLERFWRRGVPFEFLTRAADTTVEKYWSAGLPIASLIPNGVAQDGEFQADGTSTVSVVGTPTRFGVGSFDGQASFGAEGSLIYGATDPSSGSESYWFAGLPFVCLRTDKDEGTERWWSKGLPATKLTPLDTATVQIDGTSSVSATGSGPLFGNLNISGSSSASFVPSGTEYGTLQIDGVSTFGVIGSLGIGSALINCDGHGSLSVVPTGPEYAAFQIDGQGSLSVAGGRGQDGSFQADGHGSFSAVASGTQNGDFQIDGQGTFVVKPTGPEYGTFTITGLASVSITGIGPTSGEATLDGHGSAVFTAMNDVVLIGQFQADGRSTVSFVPSSKSKTKPVVTGTGRMPQFSRAASLAFEAK